MTATGISADLTYTILRIAAGQIEMRIGGRVGNILLEDNVVNMSLRQGELTPIRFKTGPGIPTLYIVVLDSPAPDEAVVAVGTEDTWVVAVGSYLEARRPIAPMVVVGLLFSVLAGCAPQFDRGEKTQEVFAADHAQCIEEHTTRTDTVLQFPGPPARRLRGHHVADQRRARLGGSRSSLTWPVGSCGRSFPRYAKR